MNIFYSIKQLLASLKHLASKSLQIFLIFFLFIVPSLILVSQKPEDVYSIDYGCTVEYLKADGVTPYLADTVQAGENYYVEINVPWGSLNDVKVRNWHGPHVYHNLGPTPFSGKILNLFGDSQTLSQSSPHILFQIGADGGPHCEDFQYAYSIHFGNVATDLSFTIDPHPPGTQKDLAAKVKVVVENGAGKNWTYQTKKPNGTNNIDTNGSIPGGADHWEIVFDFPTSDIRAVFKIDGQEKDILRSTFTLGCGMDITSVDKSEDPDTGEITFTVKITQTDPSANPNDYYIKSEGTEYSLEPDGANFKVTIGPIAPSPDSKIYSFGLNKHQSGPDTLCDDASVFVAGNPSAGPPGTNPCDPNCDTAIGTFSTDPIAFVGQVLTIATGLAGGIAFILMVIGAIRVLTSTGNPQNVNAGRDMIIAALAGLIFIIFSILILRFIGVNIFGDLNPFT